MGCKPRTQRSHSREGQGKALPPHLSVLLHIPNNPEPQSHFIEEELNCQGHKAKVS